MRPTIHHADAEYSKYIQLPYPVVFSKLKIKLCGEWDEELKECSDFSIRQTELIIVDFDENLGGYFLFLLLNYLIL